MGAASTLRSMGSKAPSLKNRCSDSRHTGGVPLSVETTRDRWAQLRLAEGDHAYVYPKNLRLFVQDFQI